MMIMIMARVSLLSHPLSSCCCSPCALKMHLGRKETIRKLTSSIVWEQTNSITLPRDSICSPLHFRRMPCTLKSTGMAVSAGNMRTSPTFNGISTGRVAFSVGGAQADVPAISGENREILVQHILVPEDQIKLLLELQQRIVREGVDLSDLATEYSICPSKDEGGMLGWVRKGQMVPEFEEAAFSSPLNKPVRCKTKFGWHLLEVLAEREAGSIQNIEPEELYIKMQDHNFLNEAQLMDVREPDEVSIASLPGFKIYPLRQFGSWGPTVTTDLDPVKDTYVLCHHGMRSLQVAEWLRSQIENFEFWPKKYLPLIWLQEQFLHKSLWHQSLC